MFKYFMYILCLCSVFDAASQSTQDKVRMLVEDYVSQNDEQNVDAELLYETLYELYENPIHINTASAEELSILPSITIRHIRALHDYIHLHGELLSVYELQGVYGFNSQVIASIIPFITFSLAPEEQTFKKYYKHDLLLRTTTVVEEQVGYNRPDSVSHYLGVPYSAYVKYKGALGKTYSWHMNVEQDRGEAWFLHTNVLDFWSLGFQYEGKGRIKDVIIGDYRVRFGQGLCLNNNFGYGKSSQVMDVIQKGDQLRRFTSSSENTMFRGGAINIDYDRFNIIVGGSSRRVDATLDSVGDGLAVTSFSQTGLHRTSSEVAKYKNTRINDVLAHIDFSHKNLKVGFTGSGQSLSHDYSPDERPDNIFIPIYDKYYNLALDYKWNYQGTIFYGEVASDKQNSYAMILGLTSYPSSRVGFSLIYRNYSEDYYAMYGQAFGEGSRVNNEEGLYLGTNVNISKSWMLDLYADWYRFPWLRYGVPRPTTGYDIFIQPKFTPSKHTTLHLQMKYEEKEENQNLGFPNNNIVNTKRMNLRLQLSSKLSESISIQSRVASTFLLHESDERGYLIFQDINVKLLEETLFFNLRYALYNTSSYDSRIYTYESDVLYLSSTPSFYGKGSRAYINGRYNINGSFVLYLKVAYSKKFGEQTIGSGLDEIYADHKTDVHLQLKIKL